MRLTNHERREAGRGTSRALAPLLEVAIDLKITWRRQNSNSIFPGRVSIGNPTITGFWKKMARLRSCRANRTRIQPSLEFRAEMSLSQLATRQATAASPHRHEFDVCDGSDKPRGPRGPRRHQRRSGPADVDLDRSESDAFFLGSISIFTMYSGFLRKPFGNWKKVARDQRNLGRPPTGPRFPHGNFHFQIDRARRRRRLRRTGASAALAALVVCQAHPTH